MQELQRVHETTSEAAQAERAELTRRLRRSTSDAKDTIKVVQQHSSAVVHVLGEISIIRMHYQKSCPKPVQSLLP